MLEGYDMGGVCTNNKREPEQTNSKRGSQVKEMHWYANKYPPRLKTKIWFDIKLIPWRFNTLREKATVSYRRLGQQLGLPEHSSTVWPASSDSDVPSRRTFTISRLYLIRCS